MARILGNLLRCISCLTGGFLVHLTIGTIYTYGNMNPYITSYIRKNSEPSGLNYSQSIWVFALEITGQGLAMFLGGIIERKIGSRWTALLGGWCMSTGVLLSYFTIQKSFILFLLTYGIIFGFGVGIAYAPPLNCAMKWLPERKGLANGIVVAGFGGGAFIFDQVQTAFINPNNFPANGTDPSQKYFEQNEVLNSVPKCFLLLGGIYAAVQLVGSLMMFEPPGSRENGESIPFIQESKQEEVQSDTLQVLDNVSLEGSFHPKEMIRSKTFYLLWVTFFFNGLIVMYISTLYKVYGETFLTSDKFFATVGALAAVCNSGGRIMWGLIMDRFNYRVTMMIITIVLGFLQFTYILTPKGHETMYLIWVCLMFLSFSGNYTLFPTSIAKVFGPEYVSINYGILFTSQVVAGLIGALLSKTLKDSAGWFGLFCITGAISVTSAVLAFFTKV